MKANTPPLNLSNDSTTSYHKTSRNSGIELLRIICMISIILSHYYTHGINTVMDAHFFSFIPQFLAVISNAIFFLISGYFIQGTHYSLKRLILLVLEILFYNYIILAVNIIIFKEQDLVTIAEELFPISSGMNWFLSAYVFIYAIGPFLKKLCSLLREQPKLYNAFVITLFFFYSVLGFITPGNVFNVPVFQGFFLVILGDYMSLHRETILNFHYKAIGILSFALALITTMVLHLISMRVPVVTELADHVIKGSSPLTIICACSMLIGFSRFKFKSRVINAIASSTMAVYLVHDNNAFRSHIWHDIFAVQLHLNHYVSYSIFPVVSIFVFIIILDKLRKNTVEKLVSKALTPVTAKCQLLLEKLGVPY